MSWLVLVAFAAAFAAAAPWTVQQLPFSLENGETARKHLPATMPGGVAVFDFDNDGRLDIYLANGGDLGASGGGKKASNRLLRNLGKMQFADVTAQAEVSGVRYDIAAIAGDYDADGHVDLLVCGVGGVTLYRNTGKGSFADVTKAAGVDNQGRWSVGGVWFDADRDGDLDLFVLNYVRWNPATERRCVVDGKPDFCHPRFYDSTPNALFRNNGDGTFTDISEPSGIGAHAGKGMGVAAADFDGDGWTDLFVTNDREFAFLFRNTGGGKFVEAAFEWGVAVPQDGNPVSGMGVDAQDYDNDGRPDLIYTALRDETFPLYRNRKGKDFFEATAASRMSVLSRRMAGWGIMFADLDNDGWKDIAAARSDALSPLGGKGAGAREPLSWFRNLADGKFALGEGWPSDAAMYRGLVAADLDNDGCLDVVATALAEQARVLRNPCAWGSNWIAVKAPVGARVRVGKQWRVAGTAVGYGSSYVGPLHFGIANEQDVEVEVFPATGNSNGRKQQSQANRVVELVQ